MYSALLSTIHEENEPSIIRVDEETIFRLVEECKPKRVAFNAPDGLLRVARKVAERLESTYVGLQTIVIADPTYGSCDTVDIDAQRLGAQIAFHMGHNVSVSRFGKITHTIHVWDDSPFDEVSRKASEVLKEKGIRSVGLATFAQYVHRIRGVSEVLKGLGITCFVGKGQGQLHDGQIFGCEFYPAYNIRDKVEAMLLLGRSMFHAIGLCLSTGKRTFILDPHTNEVIEATEEADHRLRRAILSVFKARDAERFGVVIGLKEGQIMVDQSAAIKKKLESFGKTAQLIALREVTSERLSTFTDLDAFVQTGCPRISVDGYNFSRPILSVPQAEALFGLLSGKELEADILVRKHWL